MTRCATGANPGSEDCILSISFMCFTCMFLLAFKIYATLMPCIFAITLCVLYLCCCPCLRFMLLLCHYHRYLSKLPRLPVRVSVSPLLVPVVLSGILPRHPSLQFALYFPFLSCISYRRALTSSLARPTSPLLALTVGWAKKNKGYTGSVSTPWM